VGLLAPVATSLRLGYDRRLCADVLGAFTKALKRSLRWRAKRTFGLRSVRDAQTGALTFVQRADSPLRLNVHFHTLALDGVYVRDEEGELRFRELGAPRTEDAAQVETWTHASLLRVLKRHGRSLDGITAVDPFATDQPADASCYGASAADVQLLGRRRAARPTSSFGLSASCKGRGLRPSQKSAASTSTLPSRWTVATVSVSSAAVVE
jgi:hypothetical protein